MLTGRSPHVGSWRDRTVDRMSTPPSGDPRATWAGVATLLIGSWVISYLAGGSQTALPHLFYAPIVVVALRFGGRAALAAAVAAGLAAGPLLPLDVAAGTAQDAANWLVRLAAFVGVGQLTAFLSRHSLPSVSGRIAANRFRSDLEAALDHGHIRVV